MHNAARQTRENTHMLIASGMFVERQHNNELCIIITPTYRRLQARYADGGLLNMFGFAVWNGEAKT